MSVVLRFQRRHRCASAGSRAAKSVSKLAVTPLEIAVSVERTADHHSAGMASRCHHFETVQAPAPGMSEAMPSREGHSSIIFLNEVKSDIGRSLGQLVLKRKDNLTLDARKPLGHTVRMAENDTEAEYKQEFMQRVADARIARGLKQWQIAEALGMPQDKYKQYEKRSLLPHHLIGRFCIICRVEPEWLVTGRGAKPLRPPHVVDEEKDVAPKPKRARRSKAA